jgi:hypothetical protein
VIARSPVAFHDLPLSKFPFTAELLDAETGEVRWSLVITGPGVVRIPPKTEINEGRPVTARLTFADGEVQVSAP